MNSACKGEIVDPVRSIPKPFSFFGMVEAFLIQFAATVPAVFIERNEIGVVAFHAAVHVIRSNGTRFCINFLTLFKNFSFRVEPIRRAADAFFGHWKGRAQSSRPKICFPAEASIWKIFTDCVVHRFDPADNIIFKIGINAPFKEADMVGFTNRNWNRIRFSRLILSEVTNLIGF